VRNIQRASGLAGCAGWAGWLHWLGWRAEKASVGLREDQGGLLRWLQADTLLFLFVQTEIETEKHRVKGEEFEYKENILKLLELSTI